MPAPLVKIDLEFPYTRSVGPVIGAYLDGLEAGRLLASRAGDRTLSPPLEYDPVTGASVEPELVEVGPEGVVTSWTWIDTPNPNHPLDRPFAFALIQLDDGPRVSGWIPWIGKAADLPMGQKVEYVSSYKPGMMFEKR